MSPTPPHAPPSPATLEASSLRQLADLLDPFGADTAIALATPRPDYLSFLRETLPPGWTADAAHIRLIAEHLDAVDRGEIDRLAIHMPPRHGKSESVTYRYPVRYLEANPRDNVLVTGYNERFARKFGRRTRNIARTRGLVAGDKAAADEWETTSGGLLMTRGVGSPPTGTGFARIVIDDPIRRRQDAESEVFRESVWDWYTDDLYTRLEPGGAIILIMTLWHEDDVGARAVASEPGRWTVLKLPALALDGDPLGRRPGEALWPERWGVEHLYRVREVMARNEGERSFEALYQQNPTPREGSFFKVNQLQFLDAEPVGLRSCRAWDIASTGGGGDYTPGVKIGTDGQRYYVLHVARGQWEPGERNRTIRLTAEIDGRETRIHVPQDPGAAGKDLAGALTQLLAGFAITAEPVTGKKETRADSFAAQVNAGNVTVIRGDWDWRAFVEELRQFPQGKHDDQVDAASDAFTELTGTADQGAPAWGGSRPAVAEWGQISQMAQPAQAHAPYAAESAPAQSTPQRPGYDPGFVVGGSRPTGPRIGR